MVDARNLEPCHFCGSRDLRAVTGPVPHLWGVICDGCGCFLDCRAKTKAAAIAAWNRRAPLASRPSPAAGWGEAEADDLARQVVNGLRKWDQTTLGLMASRDGGWCLVSDVEATVKLALTGSALAPSPGTREAGLERATALIFETMCQLAQDYDIPRETVWNDPDAMDAARETARAALRALAAPDEEGRPTPATPTGEPDHGE